MDNVDSYEIYVAPAKKSGDNDWSKIKVPDDEWLQAKLVKIDSKEGKYGPMFQFSFRLEGEQYQGKYVWISVGKEVSTNPNAKTYKYYRGLLGRELNPEEKIVLAPLIGKTFEVFLESKIDGTATYQNVTKVRVKETVSTSVTPVTPTAVKQQVVKQEKVAPKAIHEEVPKEVKKEETVPDLDDLSLDDLDLDSDIPL